LKRSIVSTFALAAAVATLAATSGCGGGENPSEKLADRVTAAIVANDMRPVQQDFNATIRPQLRNRAKVGKLSDDLAPLGKFKRTKETTPAGTPKNTHYLTAQFEHGTYDEKMVLDEDGKISAFDLRPTQGSSSASQGAALSR
jgi:hypothetical protein